MKLAIMINPSEVLKKTGSIGSDFAGPIVLHMIDQNGYGDVSLAIKTVKFLINKYPHAPIHIIGQRSSIEKIQEIEPDFLDKSLYSQIDIIDYLSNTHWDICEKAKLEIETAIFNYSLAHTKSNTPHSKIFIGEYGSYERNPYEPPLSV